MGDMNAIVGVKKKGKKVVGNFEIGDKNERGDLLVEFAGLNSLYILNIFSKKLIYWI
jgi:hypothetical protein